MAQHTAESPSGLAFIPCAVPTVTPLPPHSRWAEQQEGGKVRGLKRERVVLDLGGDHGLLVLKENHNIFI